MSAIQNKSFINNTEAVASIVDTILLAPSCQTKKSHRITNLTQSMQNPSVVYFVEMLRTFSIYQ